KKTSPTRVSLDLSTALWGIRSLAPLRHPLPAVTQRDIANGSIEAGIDCLQVIEVKAGMDLLKLYHDFGDHLSFMGGIDVRVLYTNDRAKIDAELEAKIPVVKGNNGYILHSDHSIPNTVDFDTYEYFVRRGLELGTYNQ
ncbi:MAG: hypothetical protein HY318_09000, partial [Armatimonadetes bacterium]|nr:hypothetical protein [Armatimonadota bacterium]